MDAARALADLAEISPQIEAAVVLGSDGEAAGSVGVSDWWATAAARAGRDLLNAAAEQGAGKSRVTQVHASLAEGDVFAVAGDAGRSILAVTAARQAPGLVFYDLKRCLASLAEPEPKPEPAPEPAAEPKTRRRRWGRKRKAGDEA